MSRLLDLLPVQPVELELDENLVKRARGGEHAAFDELVRRHRLKAFSWATRLSHDPHMAEDIVQDALIRAFLHLGKLVHDGRFLGWLKRIVQNQALMKLRRGGPYARETPLTAYQLKSDPGKPINPEDLDSIMGYLLTKVQKSDSSSIGIDPLINLERQDWYLMLRSMLRSLTAQERKIFEAYFFQECTPADIAELFKLSVGNVYKIISRSRHKVQQERLSFLISAHIRQRKDDGYMVNKVLDKQSLMQAGGSLLSGTETLFRMLKVRFPKLSLAYIDGSLTSAFILNIEKAHVDMSSTNMVDRNYLILNGMKNMGMVVRYAEAFDFEPPDPKLTLDAIQLAKTSVDRGIPAIAWELLRSEFGLIYGYDDNKQHFYGIDTQDDQLVSYDRLGRLQTRSLFVLGVVDEIAISPSDALWRICRMICRHANGQDSTFNGYVNGLPAYDTWIEVLQQKEVEPLGHAFTISVVLEGRQHATQFLQELAIQWEGDTAFKQEIQQLLVKASDLYNQVALSFSKLTELFPKPSGGEPNSVEESEKAIDLLNKAKDTEKEAVEVLTLIADQLEKHSSRDHVPAIQLNPPRAYNMLE